MLVFSLLNFFDGVHYCNIVLSLLHSCLLSLARKITNQPITSPVREFHPDLSCSGMIAGLNGGVALTVDG